VVNGITKSMASEAQKWHDLLMSNKAQAAAAFMTVGMALWYIKWKKVAVNSDGQEVRMYEALGYDSFESYVAGAADMQRSNAYKLIGLYQTYFVDHPEAFTEESLSSVDMLKLEMIRPVISGDKEKNSEWLEKAKVLGRQDLRVAVNEARGRRAPEPDPSVDGVFAEDNRRLAFLNGKIINSVRMGPDGLVLTTDDGARVRLWALAVPAAGDPRAELRYHVSERR